VKRLIMLLCLTLTAFIFAVSGDALTVRAQGTPDSVCAAAPAARLKKGDKAKIINPNAKDLPGGFIKVNADRVSPVLRFLPVGTVVDVLDGPICGPEGDRWFSVKIGDVTGYMAEANGKEFALEPFSGGDAPTLQPSTTMAVLECIAFNTAMPTITPTNVPTEPAGPTPTFDPALPTATYIPAPAKTGQEVTRVAFGNAAGEVQVSDDGQVGRVIAKFDLVPLSVDLSPDGSAVLVATLNGLYWVDVQTGNTVMVADGPKFALREGGWVNSVRWLPDMRGAAVEVVERLNGIVSYGVWSVPLDGTFPPFRVDTGSQAPGGILRSPRNGTVLMLSANDISPFPVNATEITPALLEYVPRMPEGENQVPVMPAVTWNADDTGFYTHIPISDLAPEDDNVGGHIWYVPLNGPAVDLGKLTQLNPIDYVIPSGDGLYFMSGRGATWTIRDTKTQQVVQTLPPVTGLYNWTPDNKGVVYKDQNNETKYLGVDGGTESPYIPSLTNLYDIRWLSDGSPIYTAIGGDKKLSLSVKPQGKDAAFLSIVPTLGGFSGRVIPTKPTQAIAPAKCS
jgi:hypothetical protein